MNWTDRCGDASGRSSLSRPRELDAGSRTERTDFVAVVPCIGDDLRKVVDAVRRLEVWRDWQAVERSRPGVVEEDADLLLTGRSGRTTVYSHKGMHDEKTRRWGWTGRSGRVARRESG